MRNSGNVIFNSELNKKNNKIFPNGIIKIRFSFFYLILNYYTSRLNFNNIISFIQ